MKYLEAACLVAITAILCWLLIDARDLIRHADADLHGTQTDYQRVAQELVGTMAPLRATLKASRDSSDQVAKNSAAATATLDADLVKFGKTIDDLDSLIAGISTDAAAITKQSGDSFAHVNLTFDELKPSIDALNLSAAQLVPIMGNLNATSSQAVVISANTAKTTAEIDQTAHDVRQVADAFRSDYLKPKNRLWLYFKTIVGLASNAGNISALAK
jgi:methyl-accepting chemotaxis protein